MSVAGKQVAEAAQVAEAQIHGGGNKLPSHLVKRANEARKMREAFSVLEKALKVEKTFFDGEMDKAGVTSFQDASGRTIVQRNFASPMRLSQSTLRERYPRQAEECTFADPYTFVTFP